MPKDYVNYNPETGVFKWAIGGKSKVIGKVAGSINSEGYRVITINKVCYHGGRLAWYISTGRWPVEIDHINGVRSDDRLSNLREVTHRENMFNTEAHRKVRRIILENKMMEK